MNTSSQSLTLSADPDLLHQLRLRTNTLQQVLDSQPVFTTVMSTALTQQLGALVPDIVLDPDTVFLNEYRHDAESLETPRITQSRTLTQVLQAAITTGKAPTLLTKEPVPSGAGLAAGFYRDAGGAGPDGNIAELAIEAFNTLIKHLSQDCQATYEHALEAYWSMPHPAACGLSAHDVLSQQQREVFRLEADLKLADAVQQVTDAEQALGEVSRTNTAGKSAIADAQQTLTTARDQLTAQREGRQLIENLLSHETGSNKTSPPVVLKFSLTASGQPEWSVPVTGAFVLAERVHSPRPVVLYIPQYGIETFSTFAVMENTLRRRLVTDSERTTLLANVQVSERARATEVLRERQSLSYTEITEPVFSERLRSQRDRQEADIFNGFSTSRTTYERLTLVLQAALALPLGCNKSLLARLGAPVIPTLASPSTPVPADSAGQTYLIRLWSDLNDQILAVLTKDQHPSFDSVLPPLLQETFAQVERPVNIDKLYVNRYRTDSTGIRQLESSRPLRKALSDLLSEQTPPMEDDVVEGVFSSSKAVNEAEQIARHGSLQGLADALRSRLPEQVTRFWRTPAGAATCPQMRLTDLHRQSLDVQARLRLIDDTLTPQAKLLIDCALQYPTQAQREAAFRHGVRPGVYQLTVENGTPEGARLAASFILTPGDGAWTTSPHWPNGHKNISTNGVGGATVHGPVVLYTPGQGFEEFPALEQLHQTLVARINAGGAASELLVRGLPLLVAQTKTGLWGESLRTTFMPIEGDFLVNSVQALLDKQQDDIDTLLDLAGGSAEVQTNGIADLAEQLDTASAFLVRNQLLLESSRPDWEKQLSPSDQSILQALGKTAEKEQEALAKLWQGIPTLRAYAKEKVLDKIRAFLGHKGSDGNVRAAWPPQGIDPDKCIVTHSKVVRLNQSGFGMLHESNKVKRISLTNLLLNNTHPWEKSLSSSSWDSTGALLITSNGQSVLDARGQPISIPEDVLEQWLNDINVGPGYIDNVLKKKLDPDATTGEAHQLKQAWMAAQAAALQYAAAYARLSPDAYSTPLASEGTEKRGAAWVTQILTSPSPATRNRVDDQPVIANALLFNPANDAPDGRGGQTLNGVLVISTDVDESIVLYTPDAPDGMTLREVKSEAEFVRLASSGSAWKAYFKARLPADTRLLNPRLAPHTGDFLPGLYRQNFLYLIKQTDAQTVSNKEREYQSTFNKVMFGIEVVTTVLSMFPWATQQASSAVGWWGKMARTTVQTWRRTGQNIPGLIVRQGFAGRVIVEMATETAAQAARATGIGVKPLQVAARVARVPAGTQLGSTALSTLSDAFRQQRSGLTFPGGVPSGSSMSTGTGIYRAPGGEMLIRDVGNTGEVVVYRIQSSFNMYGGTGLVVGVLTPSGTSTSFRLRRIANDQWSLDTLERARWDTRESQR
ncbi:dermonecrotic toxin domain-containing protein [Pseudomonas fluorescens]|uniref:Dermonecrotic toxin N-terminal domain-containing protein n=1 Tax=Pseudomonas fluorescens TaxID=294 RepID=A0A5E7EH00_PSEFL|nr:DUF6543 domain-containing protein [Pseudomonas fluorescens]VVO25882.1 hypothetical protein PS691_04552 [Pseudomonas fluorescens]